jgi:hypothetical protein
MSTTNEIPEESIERLRAFIRERDKATGFLRERLITAAHVNQTLPADVPNQVAEESDEDGNAFRGLFFAVLLLSVFASGVALGVAILYLIAR